MASQSNNDSILHPLQLYFTGILLTLAVARADEAKRKLISYLLLHCYADQPLS